jgi:hypothetical protein
MSDSMLMMLAMPAARKVCTLDLSSPDLICSWCRPELLKSNSAKHFWAFFWFFFPAIREVFSQVDFRSSDSHHQGDKGAALTPCVLL